MVRTEYMPSVIPRTFTTVVPWADPKGIRDFASRHEININVLIHKSLLKLVFVLFMCYTWSGGMMFAIVQMDGLNIHVDAGAVGRIKWGGVYEGVC